MKETQGFILGGERIEKKTQNCSDNMLKIMQKYNLNRTENERENFHYN